MSVTPGTEEFVAAPECRLGMGLITGSFVDKYLEHWCILVEIVYMILFAFKLYVLGFSQKNLKLYFLASQTLAHTSTTLS